MIDKPLISITGFDQGITRPGAAAKNARKPGVYC
jgi:hypothetical protein